MSEVKESASTQFTVRNVVENFSEGKNIYIVHGLESGVARGANTLLRQNVSWEERMDILLALQPTISASTITEGGEYLRAWSPMGVILKGGNIEFAYSQDAGSRAVSFSKRDVHGNVTEEQLSQTINSKSNYNEVGISSPEIAGIYFNLDNVRPEEYAFKLQNLNPVDAAKYAIEELEMPVYVFEGGKLYRGQIEDGKLVPDGEVVTSQDILQSDYKVKDDKKDQLLEKIMNNSPFRREVLNSLDAHLIYYWEDGKRLFVHMFPEKVVQELEQDVKEGERYVFLTVTDTHGNSHRYYAQRINGELKIYSWWKDYARVHPWVDEINNDPNLGEVGDRWYDSMAGVAGFGIKLPLHNPKEYFESALKGVLDVYKQWRELDPNSIQDRIAKHKYALAFHFYGFAKAAEFVGDTETANEAYIRAEKLLPRKEYERIIEERIGPNREFRLKPEDIESLK